MVDIEEMLKTALFDGILTCPKCEYGDLEPDYDSYPECHTSNPLKKGGFI